MNRLAILSGGTVLLAIGVAAGPAAASQQGNLAVANWKLMDKCARQAQIAFPDYTAEANAKRDAALKACLSSNNLPPRPELLTPQSR